MDQLFTQRDFSAGELDVEARRQDEVKLQRAGARVMRNVRPRPTGGVDRRPGMEVLFHAGGVSFRVQPLPTVKHRITLTGLTFTVRDDAGTVITTIGTCPWSAGDVAGLVFDVVEKEIWVTHRDGAMRPQIFTFDATGGTWSRADFSFATSLAGKKRQPFYRFSAPGTTMLPSARTGSITVTFSAPVLVAGHVGVSFLYVDREILITAVTNATTGTATVVEGLPPSQRLTMASTADFLIGDLVEGVTSGAKGQIIALTATTLDVLVTKTYAGFQNSEKVVGPTGTATLTAVASISPLATVQWEEAFISAVRGWPGSLTFDRSRTIICRFPQLKNGVCWSAIGARQDFQVTALADGGIFETIPGDIAVYHVIGGADQFVITDKGVRYIPISASSPLAPGSVEFRRISSDGCSDVRPLDTNDGAVFVAGGGVAINAIITTGQQTQPYVVKNLTEWHSHLLWQPVALAATVGAGQIPHSYLYVVNGDGSMVVARYNSDADWVGWIPWQSAGAVRHASGFLDELLLSTTREIGVTMLDAVERLAPTRLLDGCRVLAGAAPHGLTQLAGATVHLFRGERYLGPYAVSLAGDLVDAPPTLAGDYVGFNFTPVITPFVPSLGEGQALGQRMRRRRIARAAVTVEKSQSFSFAGRLIPAFNEGENEEAAAPRRSRTSTFRQLGRSHEPEISLVQETPGFLSVLEIALEVSV